MSRVYARLLVLGAVLPVVVGLALVGPADRAGALSRDLAFSASDLPTWQTDGVAYAVAATQGKVVVGGSFGAIRPPTGQPGVPLAVTGLAVLDADTGKPDSCQLPVGGSSTTPTVYALTVSTDGRTVYAAGNFRSVAGTPASRVAAIDLQTCTVRAMQVPEISSTVYGLAATPDALYLAGAFTSVGDQSRPYFAAVDPTSGALLPWNPVADQAGRALTVSPDGRLVAIGGSFFTVGGVSSHSLAVVDAGTGALVRAYARGFIDDASSTKALASDGDSFYVGNEGFGATEFDGRLAVSWSSLDQRWRDTCKGATQALVVYRGLLYSANHAHDCGSIGYYQNGLRKYFIAESTVDHSFRGWTPEANDGIGEHIGGRGLGVAVGSSGRSYLYAVGEFTQIDGHAQQGITRFGTTDTTTPPVPTLQAEALTGGKVQVRVPTVVDDDDDTLTYSIYRDGSATPVWQGDATSWWWSRPQITFVDTHVEVGRRYAYRVRVSDGTSTSGLSSESSATVVKSGAAYPTRVVKDSPTFYWRYDEAEGSSRTADRSGRASVSAMNGLLAKGAATGAVTGVGGGKGATFDGVDDYAWEDQLHAAPQVFTVETWFRTRTKRGGTLVTFTDGRPRTNTGVPLVPTHYDRQIYLGDDGRVRFGVKDDAPVVLTTATAANDGRWHHVVAEQGPAGMSLYLDGALEARNQTSAAQSYPGVWFVGDGKVSGWPDKPTSAYLAADVDETAVYEGKVLDPAAVAAHQQAGLAKPSGLNRAPSDAFGKAVFAAEPSLWWRLDEKSGTVRDHSLTGAHPGRAGSSVGRRKAGPTGGYAVTTSGGSAGTVSTTAKARSPQAVSVGAWVRSTSTRGGKLAGLESSASGSSSKTDRSLYVDAAGALRFGSRDGSVTTTVASPARVDDGRWHYVVATQDASGLRLYVDGQLAAAQDSAAGHLDLSGYWRIGGGTLSGWPERPRSDYLKASVAEPAVYAYALTPAQVAAQWDAR